MDEFIKTLIAEVKSQGVFDEFRFNCCLADVDTKPAYQNVRTRVETAVNDFLAKQHWTPDTNKVQLRERLRKHLLDSEVLDKGVDQIVDQVVNPKVATIFEPKIESIVYKYLGITPPPPPPRPTGPLLPAPPLPPFAGHMNGSSLLRVETGADGLMPTDLEQISPDSDQATIKSELKEESKDDDLPPGVDDERNSDEDTSPSYEPLSEDKPGTSKELNNGLLNHSDSINGVSQASQLSQVSSDSRLTIASSSGSVAEAQRAAHSTNSVELIANMPANISEEAQMPKFSENSSDASVAVGVDNGSRQLHFDIKQDAITFEGTERRSSVSGSNGGPLELSIEDAIMSEVKANIDDANNAGIELKYVQQPPLPPLPKAEPEPVQPPAPPDVEPEPVQPPPPPPPPPPPELKEEPAQPPAPPEIKLEPVQPSPPPEIKLEPVQPPTPPELKTERKPCQIVAPPAESSIASLSEAVVQNAEPMECNGPLKQELQESQTEVGEVKEEKPKVFALPEDAEAPKAEVTKACESTASPSSQSKSSSRNKDKDKERRNHSHSDDKQRRRSRDRDRDRDRDRSRDKSHSKHSSSSSSKHSSSRSSSSQHRSSSSKNDRSFTSSSSKSHRESSSSKRTSSTSSSRHESSSSSSHKKHKSSSSSSRSDRDKDRERESHSKSHHSNSSSSSSSKRKEQGRGRDRDRNKPNSATTAPIQDDHTESKVKLNKRRSSDSNDEGKPPSSGCPPKSSRPEVAPDKVGESVENANGTNGNSNYNSGSNGACDSASTVSSGVVIVSDILQQSSSSFIELTAGSQTQKEEDSKKDEVVEKIVDQTEEPATQEDRLSAEPQNPEKAESVPNSPDKECNHGDGPEEPLAEAECISAAPAETGTSEPSGAILTEAIQKEAVKPENMPATPVLSSSDDEPAEDLVTHFEENADEFTHRLQLINRLIEDGQNLVNQLSEDNAQVEASHIREIRRRTVKRRCNSLQDQPQVVRESTPPPLFASLGSSSTFGSPTKRLRREEPKSSPTPSEASVNSKENEALEKQEHDALNARRFSQKLCQQQRYTNDDLYKPRPILSQRSRRRGLDSIL
ncbi:serine/arginine repetitive matrix protein 2 isoform X1 [Drosophila serrata]|uniref:serine/arginine repetitive matrix protein 2 isoform X1 n=1 Tax=Drosophila serrata TaxID=7274 RepID=UPI000A1D0DBD|nr:serine/arginine repetitive matrix protein 2 isoform X1 [Drosophila serrata]